MYDFGYLENVDKNLIECSNDSFQDLSTNLSTSSPSNFSSEEDDVEMKSLIEFCSLQELESSVLSTTVISCVEKVSKLSRVKKSNRFRCSFCDKTFLSQHYLRFHETSVHQKEKAFKCSLCSKSFSGDYYLKQVIWKMPKGLKKPNLQFLVGPMGSSPYPAGSTLGPFDISSILIISRDRIILDNFSPLNSKLIIKTRTYFHIQSKYYFLCS